MGRRRSIFSIPRRRSLFPRSRRRASSGDAALGILVLGAIAVAVVGVYLLIIGAIALIGWLVAVVAKSRGNSEQAHLVTTAPLAQSQAAPPQHQYHVVLPVDPRVFDDANQLEATTKTVFSAWARQLPKAPNDPSDTLRNMALRRRLIGRLTTKLDGRRFAWRSASYRGRDRMIGATPIDPAALDAYNPPSDLRTRSSYLELCRPCGGDGSIECTSCGGASRVTCIACNGAGKVDGITKSGARRLLNCKACKGKASVICGGCSRGQVGCTVCGETGRVEHWLEVEGGPRDADVQVEPDGDVTRAFTWGKDGVPASHDEIVRDAHVLCSVTHDRQLTIADLPTEVPQDWRDSYWQGIQARLQSGERIVAQQFQLLEVPSIEATYALGKDEQAIEFEGLRLLAPPVSADQLFSARAASLRRLAYGLAALPLIICIVYLARGSYFVTPAMAGVVFCAALAALVTYLVFSQASLGRFSLKWLAGSIVPIAAATALAIVAEPSENSARRYIDNGRLDLARAELNALGTATGSNLWADVHLREALSATSCPSTVALAARIGANAPQRVKAQDHADKLAFAAAETALKEAQLDASGAALACASEAARNGPEARGIQARIKIAAANNCLRSGEWSCALERANEARALGAERDAEAAHTAALTAIRSTVDNAVTSAKAEGNLARRVALQRTAIDLWTRYLLAETGSDPPQLVALKAAAAKDQQALAKIEEAARIQREAEERRREAAEQRKREAEERAEKRRLAEEERRQNRPSRVQCCDGTLSPSCMCGGSLRGCCSHHGGVCGCN